MRIRDIRSSYGTDTVLLFSISWRSFYRNNQETNSDECSILNLKLLLNMASKYFLGSGHICATKCRSSDQQSYDILQLISIIN